MSSEVQMILTLTSTRCPSKPFLFGAACGHRLVKVTFSEPARQRLKQLAPARDWSGITGCLKPGMCAISTMSQISEVLELLR